MWDVFLSEWNANYDIDFLSQECEMYDAVGPGNVQVSESLTCSSLCKSLWHSGRIIIPGIMEYKLIQGGFIKLISCNMNGTEWNSKIR